MPEPCSSIFGSGFPGDLAEDPYLPNSLLALEIFFGNPIDLGFSAIFIKDNSLPDRELSYKEITDLIIEAKALGIRKIAFTGKKAASCPYIKDAISYSTSLDIDVIVLKDDYHLSANSENNIPPLCARHRFSCVVTSYGYVLPCPGLHIPLGNILNQKLSDILKDSEILCDLKDGPSRIKGPCRICENAQTCYGCRARAYLATGDYLASDPLCAGNEYRRHEIISLPLPVDRIIPQMPPMRIIDTIDKLAERCAQCSVLIKEDMPFIEPKQRAHSPLLLAGLASELKTDTIPYGRRFPAAFGGELQKDGSVDHVAYLEMMAQSIAALNGFRNMGASDSAPEGYLLGAKNLKINKSAYAGDSLSIMVFKYARYGGFGIVKGVVKRDNEILAEGEIKIWHKTDE
ncbi:MAG: SPASM domain-containing protein [Desulfobacterales bacterium]|nr:SPASM domain-containing protein [Desulfobacterales bacterium]